MVTDCLLTSDWLSNGRPGLIDVFIKVYVVLNRRFWFDASLNSSLESFIFGYYLKGIGIDGTNSEA